MFSLLIVIPLLVIFFIRYFALAGLKDKLAFKLVLLLLGQLTQLIDYFWVVLQATCTNNVSRFSISFSLGHLIMLLTHVHIPCSVSGILLPTIIEAWKLLFQLSSTSSDVLFSSGFVSLHTGVKVLNDIIHIEKHVFIRSICSGVLNESVMLTVRVVAFNLVIALCLTWLAWWHRIDLIL